MKEKELLEKLNNLQDIKPKNEVYISNLKKRVINQRLGQIGENKSESIERNKNLSGFTIFLGFSMVIALLLGAVTLFIVPINNSNIDNASLSNIEDNELLNTSQLDIGGDLVLAQQFELEGHWVKIKLPSDWVIQNENYDVDKLEDVSFKNNSKKLIISSNIPRSVYATAESTISDISNSDVDISTNVYEVQKKELERYIDEVEYENNYIVYLSDVSSSIVFSSEEEADIDFIRAIISDISISDPFDGWQETFIDDFDLKIKLPSDWVYQSEVGSEFKKSFVKDNIELNISKVEELRFDQVSEFNKYGNSFQILEQEVENNLYSMQNEFGENFILSIYSINQGDRILIDLDDVTSEERAEIELIMSSIKFDYMNYNSYIIESTINEIYISNEINLIRLEEEVDDVLEIFKNQSDELIDILVFEPETDVFEFLASSNEYSTINENDKLEYRIVTTDNSKILLVYNIEFKSIISQMIKSIYYE